LKAAYRERKDGACPQRNLLQERGLRTHASEAREHRARSQSAHASVSGLGSCRLRLQWLHVAQSTEPCMNALIDTLIYALSLYWWIIIASAIFSWLFAFNVVNSRNQFVSNIGTVLYRLTEPVYRPIRRFLPDLGGIDISPIIVLLVIFFLQRFLDSSVRSLFY
jgi:YggT family protein